MAGFRSNGEDELAETHEINVTPFIDVILVLLIIFMVAAPLSTVDVPVDLPGSTASRSQRPDEPVFLSLQKDLTLSLKNAAVAREGLGAQLDAATGGDRETRIFLRADEAVAYGDVMRVMDLLRGAGYLKVALVGLEARPEAAP
ncbi:TonB system transport protein ExbD [Cereibacter sphaeroides]|uniref:TonB system transport protein ExbD n=1 Tax=Cereibacter sphaeroides TaxID=1063 RepID=UPI001F41B29A|nr:TonB system transport protein ExbD [Cereibacter sphaeroides]MCE6959957.1 TonB system transport protein ExbD [Cereibacter sphaeroides]MCE6968526.1 TonB system transport protein ExbD [Cereibacter sphaeroides]MCE6973042.1 TonB system transport protein ExbD [Cereibacter sphaeroides]